MPVEIERPGDAPWVNAEIPDALSRFVATFSGLAFALPENLTLPDFSTASELRACLAKLGFVAPEGYTPETSEFILVHGATTPTLFWLAPDDDLYKATAILPTGGQRLDSDHARLRLKTVGIVGCGSVGAKIATMLARSGLVAFVLIDDDIFTPENVVRHDLDWTSIGEHKVDAVARRIKLIAPGAKCTLRRQRLGGQESGGVADWSLTLLRQCDLIIDATANPHVFNLLSSIAEGAKCPLIWAEVFAGGIGGLVARSRPALDPDPQIVRARVNGWCAEKGVPAPHGASGYESLREGNPLIADDADVTVMAAHAARLCIDALLARTPSWFPVSAYLVGLAPGWLFGQPFQTFPIDVGKPTASVEADVPPDPNHIAAILRLIEKGGDESPPTP